MLSISLLGPLEVAIDDRPVSSFISTKAQALLCYLAVTGQAHSRHALAGMLWGEDTEAKAKNSLRVALANLRKLLPGYIEATRQTAEFVTGAAHRLDIDDLARLARTTTPQNIDNLRQAAELIRGEFLQDFQVEGTPAFEEWIAAQRAYWNDLCAQALSRLAALQMDAHAYTAAAVTLQRLLQLEPWQESAHRQLMLAFCYQGDFNRALAQYETCRRLLDEELGVEPAPETKALFQRVQTAREGRPFNLPPATGPFFGREDEEKRILEMLLNPECRLVTITGIGGIGKTDLALACGRLLNDEAGLHFLDGITYVPLQGVEAASSESDAIATAVAGSLSIFLPGRRPPAQEVLEYLQPEEQLLILDNFEHLLNGAAWLAGVLAACPGVKLLVTSREPLNLSAEWRVALLGLPFPGRSRRAPALSRRPESFASVQLFVQAAQQARPSFLLTAENTDHVVDLCRLVMGMPLAIKIAASWLRIMPTEQLAKELRHSLDILSTRMRDLPVRQRTIRAVFDQTWEMLPGEERRVLAGLSVFLGGFTAHAAGELTAATPFDLANLQDRGLLQYEARESRYLVHELIRQYAAEKLATTAESKIAARDAHSRYFAAYLRDQIPRLLSPELPAAMLDIDVEIDNVRAGWRWAAAANYGGVLTDLSDYARALRIYYLRRGRYHEGLEMCRLIIERIETPESIAEPGPVELLMGQVLLWQGVFYQNLGDLALAVQNIRQSREQLTSQESPDPFTLKDIGGANHMLGVIEAQLGNYEASQHAYRQSEMLDLSQGDAVYVVKSASARAVIYVELGEYDKAQALLEETLPDLRKNNDFYYRARALGGLARVRARLGKPLDDVVEQLRDNLEGSRALKSPMAEAQTTLNLGIALNLTGGEALAEAVDMLLESKRLFERINVPGGHSLADLWLAETYLKMGRFDQAQAHFVACLQLSRAYGLLSRLPAALLGLVKVSLQEGKALLTGRQMGDILAAVARHSAANARTREEAADLLARFEIEPEAHPRHDLQELLTAVLPDSF